MRNEPPISTSCPRETTTSRPGPASAAAASSTAAAPLLTASAASAPVSSRSSASTWAWREPRAPLLEVVLEVRVAGGRRGGRLARGRGQRRAPEVGVHDHAGGVEHPPQRRALGRGEVLARGGEHVDLARPRAGRRARRRSAARAAAHGEGVGRVEPRRELLDRGQRPSGGRRGRARPPLPLPLLLFQIGASALMRSMISRAPANASPRWGADAATATDGSDSGTTPMRCSAAAAHSPWRSIASATIARDALVGHLRVGLVVELLDLAGHALEGDDGAGARVAHARDQGVERQRLGGHDRGHGRRRPTPAGSARARRPGAARSRRRRTRG